MLEELGPDPEAPGAPCAPAAQPDEDDDEDEEPQPELRSGLRTKALIVGERGRRLVSRAGTAVPEERGGQGGACRACQALGFNLLR